MTGNRLQVWVDCYAAGLVHTRDAEAWRIRTHELVHVDVLGTWDVWDGGLFEPGHGCSSLFPIDGCARFLYSEGTGRLLGDELGVRADGHAANLVYEGYTKASEEGFVSRFVIHSHEQWFDRVLGNDSAWEF